MTEQKRKRGFALLTPEQRRELSSKGGREAHRKGTAHQWTADEAKAAGQKGGRTANSRRQQGGGQ